MNIRRISLLESTLLVISVASFIFSSCTDNRQVRQKPLQNVIVLIGDDHSARAVGCYGNDIIRTPNIDQLARQGILFENAYSNAPVCSASRQSILTGKYPHATGVTLLMTPFRDDINHTIAEHLRDNGFSTGVVGKTHFNNYLDSIPPSHGFDTMVDFSEYGKMNIRPVPDSIPVLGPWRPFRDQARVWLNADRLPTAFYEDQGYAAWVAQRSIDFLRENKDRRFGLWVGFHEPHSPFNFPVEYMNMYDPDEMPLPQGSREDDRWIPEIFRDLSEADKRGIIASYYTSVEYMDYCMGLILDELEMLGLSENTLVIYLGDQGYLLCDHKRFEKHSMWEPAIKAPLVMRMGGRYGTEIRINALVEFIDLAPTITDLLGIDPMSGVQGQSLLPVLQGEKEEIKEYAFAEFLEDNKAMICSKEWKYVFSTGQRDLGQGYATGYGPPGILHKLYNLQADPDEMTDLGKDPAYTEVLKNMKQEMLKRFMGTHPDAKNLPDSLSTEQQLVWFCEPRDIGSEPGVR